MVSGVGEVDILERLATTLAASNGSLTHEDGIELSRALSDLAANIEQALGVLRELLKLANPATPPSDVHLTPRELEVLTHLADGKSNAEIAKRCWISENTVKFHLKNVFRKLGIRDRVQAVMMARAISLQPGHLPSYPSRPDGPDRSAV